MPNDDYDDISEKRVAAADGCKEASGENQRRKFNRPSEINSTETLAYTSNSTHSCLAGRIPDGIRKDVRKQFQIVFILAAWLVATGAKWDLVQVFGWGRMIVTYSHSMSLSLAVKKTFAGDTLCGVCELVQVGKHQESDGSKVPGPKAPEKLFCVSTSGVLVCATAALKSVGLVPPVSSPLSAEPTAPPLPPPRFLA